MKLVRLRDESGDVRWGVLQDDKVYRMEGDIFGSPRASEELLEGEIVAPVDPASIFCIGLNYQEHIEETGSERPEYPELFFKGMNSLIGPGANIELPRKLRSDKVDYECELAVVIGKAAKNVKRDFALDYVLGYTCANDVSARDWQKFGRNKQWCRGKSFDTFCPVGPVLVTADEIANPNALGITTTLNGELMQESNTANMIFDVAGLIEFLSGSTTLLPGTVILTGTPPGVGMARNPRVWLQPGDTVTVEIEKIGALTNSVVEELLV